MITTPTTLILGAGASMPFGYPSGLVLRNQVVEPSMREALNNNGCGGPEVDKFQRELKRSGCLSVDAFLEHRPEFLLVGKIATALALIPCEREDQLFTTAESNWYNLLFDRMNAPWDQFARNNLSVVTFNYDRSLEWFLAEAIRSRFGKSSAEVRTMLSNFPIIHLHGKLDALDQRAYGPDVPDFESVLRAANGIHVIHEGSDWPDFDIARQTINAAERLYFIGFGYHPTNMERLGTKTIRAPKSVWGSCYQLTEFEMRRVREQFSSDAPIQLPHPMHDAAQFLRNSPALDG